MNEGRYNSVELGVRLPPCAPALTVAAEAVEVESLGYDAVWLPDSQLLWRDTWVTAAAVAGATTRIAIGTAVTNPVTRTPSVLASAAASVDEIAEGRFRLGIGTGDSAVRVDGGAVARVGELASAVNILRALGSGRWTDLGTRRVHLKAAEDRSTAPPIYIGAGGPRMLQLAGEVADGVILLTGNDRYSLDHAMSNVAAGARRAGRLLTDIHVVLGIRCYLGDVEHAQRLARPFAAKYAARSPSTWDASGLPTVLPGSTDVYPDLVHSEDWERAIAETSWIPDEVVAAFCAKHMMIGEPSDVASRLASIVDRGISAFLLMGYSSYELPQVLVREFAASVMPKLR